MKQLSICYLLAVILFGFTSKAEESNLDIEKLVHKTHKERTLALVNFYEQNLSTSDSVNIFSAIKGLEQFAEQNNDRDLFLEAALMRCHYYAYRDYFSKEFVVESTEELYQKAKKEKKVWLEARTQSLLGNYLYHSHQEYAQALEHFERTAVLIDQLSTDEFPLKKICTYQLANVYYHFGEYKESIKFLKKALNLKSDLHSYYYMMHVLNTLGLAYGNIGITDTAELYFRATLDSAIISHDSIWLAIIYGNLADNHLLQENYDEAISLFHKKINLSKKIKNKYRELIASVNLGLAFLKKNDFDKAKAISNKVFPNRSLIEHQDHLLNYYKLMARTSAYTNQPELAALYMDSAHIVKDSLSNRYSGIKLMLSKQKVLLEKHKLEAETIRQQQQKNMWLRNGIIVALGMSFIVLLLLFNRNKLIAKSKEQKALDELKLATEKLNQFKKSISEKNQMLEHLKRDLKPDKQQDVKPDVSNTIMNDLQKLSILTDKDWRDFVVLFEKVHAGFFDRLKSKYPNLSPAETRLLALSRLKFGNKEMALMLGVGTSAIRQGKSRLRKKINFPKTIDIEDFSDTI